MLKQKGYTRVIDMSAEEEKGRFFEGTGVLVLDRINGVAYVALSERADRHLAEQWVQELGYRWAPLPHGLTYLLWADLGDFRVTLE